MKVEQGEQPGPVTESVALKQGWLIVVTLFLATIATAITFHAVLHLPPFDGYDIVWFGAAAVVLCPLGQLMGSAVLPRADAKASALRRLDSLLLLGPVWVFGLQQYLLG